MEFKLKVKDIGEDGRITTIGERVLYDMDGKEKPLDWFRTEKPNLNEFVHLSSPVTVSDKSHLKVCNGFIGTFVHLNNSVYKNGVGISLFSGIGTQGNASVTYSVTEENFWRVIALFTARKLIAPDWINQKDEYMVPNTEHPDYQQWLNDALVYSLFNTSSNQSSLRQVEYKGKKWDIVNHFFFMSLAEIEALALQHNNNDVYNDCKSHPPDRFVYARLQQCQFSPDAQKVLDMARELVRKSFSLREACNNVKPEMHINTWDAGWYQIKNGLLKDNFKADYDAFVVAYKALEERLREGVYTFGFLKK